MAYNWEDIISRLNQMLRIRLVPVGLKWVKTEEELKAIPKVRIHEKHFSPCTVIGQAVQFNWTVACKSENIHANYCRGIHGMFERDEKWHSGEMFNKIWFGNLDASKAHNEALECLPAAYIAMVASPLAAGRIDDPDVCVLYTTSAQAFMLFAGYQYEKYEKLDFTFVGESTCSDSWIHTFLTGKPALALPCFADFKFAGVGETDLRLTFTPAGLIRAISGVEAMSKNGLRYPIAPYSLSTDILDGLPPHYREF